MTSLEMIANIGENLIDYTFNLASYEMNEVMYVVFHTSEALPTQ